MDVHVFKKLKTLVKKPLLLQIVVTSSTHQDPKHMLPWYNTDMKAQFRYRISKISSGNSSRTMTFREKKEILPQDRL